MMPTTVVFISGILLRLAELEKKHGSMRAAARVLKIDHGYLSRLKDGKKLNPSDAVLKKLGLRRVVQFTARSATGASIPYRATIKFDHETREVRGTLDLPVDTTVDKERT